LIDNSPVRPIVRPPNEPLVPSVTFVTSRLVFFLDRGAVRVEQMSLLRTAAGCPQPPGHRLAAVDQHRMTSQQYNSLDSRAEVTSRKNVYRAGSRGVDWSVPVSRSWAGLPSGQCYEDDDDDRVRRSLSRGTVDRRDPEATGTAYGRPPSSYVGCPRPTVLAAAAASWPRENDQERAQSTAATARLFSPEAAHRHRHHHHHHHAQVHCSSNSAPADCTSRGGRPRFVAPAPAMTLPPCGRGVRATTVAVRTEYHMTSTRPPAAMSSSGVKDGQRSRSSSRSPGACLWMGMARTLDIRPVSATALMATVDGNNRKININHH